MISQTPRADLKGPTSKGREGEGGRVRRIGKGFSLYLIIRGLMGVLESPEKVLFVSKRVGTLHILSNVTIVNSW